MAVRTLVSRGYGNGTFNGTIPLVVTRGYSISTVIVVDPPSLYRPLHAQQGDTRRLAASRSSDTSRLAAQEDQSRRLKATEPYS